MAVSARRSTVAHHRAQMIATERRIQMHGDSESFAAIELELASSIRQHHSCSSNRAPVRGAQAVSTSQPRSALVVGLDATAVRLRSAGRFTAIQARSQPSRHARVLPRRGRSARARSGRAIHARRGAAALMYARRFTASPGQACRSGRVCSRRSRAAPRSKRAPPRQRTSSCPRPRQAAPGFERHPRPAKGTE